MPRRFREIDLLREDIEPERTNAAAVLQRLAEMIEALQRGGA